MFKSKILNQLLIALIVLTAGCYKFSSAKKNQTGAKIVKINLVDDPHTLDPRLARDPSSQMLMRMFFEGLTRIGPNDQPQLALADNFEISSDLKKYTFSLRNAKWSNGDVVTAHDFVYAWKKILDSQYQTDNASQLYLLKNARAVKEGKLPMQSLGVRALDDRTLQIELEYSTPYLLELLAAPFFFPINQKVDEKNPKWAEKQESYVSNGPFLLKHWRHRDEILAKKNPDYWEAENVKIDGVEMVMLDGNTEISLFEKRQLHWAGSPLSTIPLDAIEALKKRGHLFIQPKAETAFLRVNVARAPLKHLKMRQALALGIDRAAIVEHVTRGGQLAAMRLVPPSMQLQNDPYFEDGAKEKAALLFEETFRDQGIDRASFPKLKLTYISSERSHLIAQAIQQQWNEVLDVQIELEALERKVFFDRISHQDFDLAFCSWGADFHDPVNFLEVFKYKTQSTNNTNWESSEYIQLLSDSFKLSDAQERQMLLARCEKMLMDAMPIIPIFHYTMLYMQDEALEGVFLSSLGNLDFKWANMKN